VGKAVVLGPNTAIQGQWAAQAAALGLDVGTDRSLATTVTALTYQALAVFDADDEVDDDGQEVGAEVAGSPGAEAAAGRPPPPPTTPTLLDRLHENGRAFIEQLRDAGPLLL